MSDKKPYVKPAFKKVLSMQTIHTTIAGTKFRPIDCQAAAAKLKQGDSLALEREPSNEYDANAIKVFCVYRGMDLFIGYVPKQIAATLAPILDEKSEKVRASAIEGGMKIEIGEPEEATAGRFPPNSHPLADTDDEIPF